MYHNENQNKFLKGVIAGVVLGAVGGYFLHKNKRRIMSKVWMIKAKAEIYRRLGSLKDLTQESYENTVRAVTDKYKKVKSIAAHEIDEFAERMMARWKDVKARMDEGPDEIEAYDVEEQK
ncbi:MAG: YtxH domain-containing protein [Candidatus Taylorbacteria bacterium]|nr:YtxH domain-containing protein [Candidatus Taylorbacteria bacterium]